MKVFIQIPCLNEEKTLPLVLKSIPKKIPGFTAVEILVIDDGSTDKTVEVAKKLGVKHFVRHRRNQGLSKSFTDGLDYALSHGADIIVNTDGDNQYPQADIPKLLKPIVEGRADIVIGDRQTATIAHFGFFKKKMQQFGSWVVNKAAKTNVPDTVSGFRAYSKEAAIRMHIVNPFSYCTESIIHAGRKRMAIASVPVRTNPPTRKSRLFKNMWQHMYKSSIVIGKSYFMHEPLKVFVIPGFLLLLSSLIPFVRYLWLIVGVTDPGQHLQSLLLGFALFTAGLLFSVLGVIADLIKTNRIIAETTLEYAKRRRYEKA
ncbi:MAG TPA: glycosyltransferase family 2 protein [Candidatus Saccharibacteria bacterium]|jgi:glycosyltransferase involved in cell wall biosynthesis|nr:glycosyltransferase family 2 protein [Candidatus Saccharibacteria bacterium]HMT55787.1 glycosyltransferase family 2 protein [Candidatus Saccharibacteria bacterium]